MGEVVIGCENWKKIALLMLASARNDDTNWQPYATYHSHGPMAPLLNIAADSILCSILEYV